jgi:hypothetical protein
MNDEYFGIDVIIFSVAFIIFAYVIGYVAHDIEMEKAMLDCVNSAIHTNRSLSVEEAALICGGFIK